MTDNSQRYHGQKVALRRRVLQLVSPANVLDLFAGRGEMWTNVWHAADGYLGVDRRPWRSDEPHHRLVLDNLAAIERLRLGAYNVYDCDSYGDPWASALAIAAKRTWAPGEVGALVLTDGTGRQLRYGALLKNHERLIGRHPDLGTGTRDVLSLTMEIHSQCVGAWCKRCGVEATWYHRAGGYTGGGGSQNMVYSAVVFRGIAA